MVGEAVVVDEPVVEAPGERVEKHLVFWAFPYLLSTDHRSIYFESQGVHVGTVGVGCRVAVLFATIDEAHLMSNHLLNLIEGDALVESRLDSHHTGLVLTRKIQYR